MDDLLNLNGIKVPPDGLEQEIKAALPVSDACLVEIFAADQGPQVWLVFVPDQDLEFAEIRTRLRQSVSHDLSSALLYKVPGLPKTSSGKIKRAEVRQHLRTLKQP
ncbi:MAG: hypothetical protein ACPGOY_11185 [Rhodospirillaceae bacterium]